MTARKHVHIPDPADLTGQACAVHGCALKRANAVHVTLEQLLAEVPAIDWSQQREPEVEG